MEPSLPSSTVPPSIFDIDAHLDIAILDDRWMSETQFRPLCVRAIAAARAHLHGKIKGGESINGELSIALMDDAGVQALNAQYRDQDKPTNVLSFAAQDHGDGLIGGTVLLGDVVLSFDTLTKEAKRGGISFDDHLAHLLIHGYYHLCGLDHMNDTEAEEMEGLEILALTDLGIANPYDKETYCER